MSSSQPRIVRNVGGVFLRQLYTVTVGLITAVVFARLLGPAGTGVYATVQLVPILLAGLFNMGLGPATVVLVNSDGANSFAQVKATAFYLWRTVCLIVIPVAAVLLYAFGAQLLPNIDPLLVYLALCLFPFLLLNMVYSGLLQSVEDFRSMNLVLATTPTLTCIVGIFTVAHYGPFGAISALLASTISTSAIAHWRLREHVHGPRPSGALIIRPMLTYGLKSNAADSIQLINYRADLYFVNYFVGATGAGLYALAVSLCEKLWLVADAMTAVLFPRFARLGNDSPRLLFVAASLAGAMSIGGAIVLALAAHYLIGPIFGPDFQDAAKAVNWLLPGVVAICLGKVLAAFLAARGQVTTNLMASIAATIVNLSSNLYLTPRYGIVGAAMATSSGYFVLVLVAGYGAFRELRRMRTNLPADEERPVQTTDLRSTTPIV